MKWVVDIKSSTISHEKKGNLQQAAKISKNSIFIISSWARVLMAMPTNFCQKASNHLRTDGEIDNAAADD